MGRAGEAGQVLVRMAVGCVLADVHPVAKSVSQLDAHQFSGDLHTAAWCDAPMHRVTRDQGFAFDEIQHMKPVSSG